MILPKEVLTVRIGRSAQCVDTETKLRLFDNCCATFCKPDNVLTRRRVLGAMRF